MEALVPNDGIAELAQRGTGTLRDSAHAAGASFLRHYGISHAFAVPHSDLSQLDLAAADEPMTREEQAVLPKPVPSWRGARLPV